MGAANLLDVASGAPYEGRLCAICQTPIAPGETAGRCPACDGPFHVECWESNGGCATYGCAQMPETVKAPEEAWGATHWGQADKQCPACGQKIRVAALRCRHCGTVFETAEPVSQTDYLRRSRAPAGGGFARAASIAIFLFGILPCSAPACLLFGGVWFLFNRDAVRGLPASHRMLCAMGLVASVLSTACLALALKLHG